MRKPKMCQYEIIALLRHLLLLQQSGLCETALQIAENMGQSQHTDFNEDTTNESASVVCENWTLRKNEEARLYLCG